LKSGSSSASLTPSRAHVLDQLGQQADVDHALGVEVDRAVADARLREGHVAGVGA
jgi:hypothetical protein